MATAAGTDDALRLQIELGLEDDRRRRRNRRMMILAGAALVFSLALNVIVLTAPGQMGLATRAEVDRVGVAVRSELAGARDAQSAALAAATTRVKRAQVRVAGSLPAICATLDKLGDWSFNSGTAPLEPCLPR